MYLCVIISKERKVKANADTNSLSPVWEVQLQASWTDFGVCAVSLPGHHSPLRAHSHWTGWTAGRRSSWSHVGSGGGSGLLCVHSLHPSATYLQRDSQKSAGMWSHIFPCTSLSLYISLPTRPVVYPCCCSLFAKVVSLGGSPPEPPRNSSTCTRPKLPIPCQTHVYKIQWDKHYGLRHCCTNMNRMLLLALGE